MKKLLSSDKAKTVILKFWLAGAVYFFIGWGTGLGEYAFVIDFVFILAVALFIAFRVIYNPIVRLMFDVKEYNHREQSLTKRVFENFRDFFLNVLIMIIITLTYSGINALINLIFNLASDIIIIPGEPILFGVFYTVYSELLMYGINKFKKTEGV